MAQPLKLAYILAIIAVVFLSVTVFLSCYLPEVFTGIMSDRGDSSPGTVVVVGGGLAGLSATIEATRHGTKVVLIEKEKGLGGNSAKATSGINGVGTEAQQASSIEDSIDSFMQDTIKSGDGLANEDLVKVLVKESADAHLWLRSFGLNLTDVVQLGGHSARRTHRFPPTPEGKPIPVGFTILSTLRKHVENELKDKVTVHTSSVFKQLLTADNSVIGVEYVDGEGNTQKAYGNVILAAGGYANDHTDSSLLDTHRPDLSKLPTTNGPWATGDIIKATSAMGLSLVHMDKVQVHPTGFIEPSQPNFHTKFLAPEALRGCGAILLNTEGKRFVNELGRRDYVTQTIFKECGSYKGDSSNPTAAAMLLSQQVIDKFGPPSAGFYKFKKLIVDVSNLQGVAENLGVPVETIKATLAEYKANAEKGSDKFGKQAFPTVFSEDDHFFVGYITPSLHYCMGGLQIEQGARILRKDASQGMAPVPGLYAAGEVSGGLHGNNRLGGNSLLECVVFGRVAGRNAAHYKASL